MKLNELPRVGDVKGMTSRFCEGWCATIYTKLRPSVAVIDSICGPLCGTETAAKRDLAFMKRHAKNMVRAMREEAK